MESIVGVHEALAIITTIKSEKTNGTWGVNWSWGVARRPEFQMELLSPILWGVREYYWGRRERGPSCMLTLWYLWDKRPMGMTCPKWMKNQAVHHSLHFCVGELFPVQYTHRSGLKSSSSNYDNIVISLALRFLTLHGFHFWRLVETQIRNYRWHEHRRGKSEVTLIQIPEDKLHIKNLSYPNRAQLTLQVCPYARPHVLCF